MIIQTGMRTDIPAFYSDYSLSFFAGTSSPSSI